MKKVVLACLLATVFLAPASTALAHDYEGWETIRPLLKDGAGDEFVKDVGLAPDYFTGATELEAVRAAANWIADNYTYKRDANEVWTDSDQMYSRLEGDCEDWAILLAALLRFHTQYDEQTITADKVWVAINLVTEPGSGVVAAHAWVGYRLDKGGKIHIEPGLTGLYRGQPNGMLNFNDSWVKGGGRYLAGP